MVVSILPSMERRDYDDYREQISSGSHNFLRCIRFLGVRGLCRFGVVSAKMGGDAHITAQELLPIVIAAAVWGVHWKGKSIEAKCDNTAAVACINSGSCRNQEAMHLRRCLAFIAARYIWASHLKGVDNTQADGFLSGSPPTGKQAAHYNSCSLAGPSHSVQAGLDLSTLDAILFSKRTSHINPTVLRYTQFCESTTPALEHQLSQYISFLALENVSHSTIKCYLSVESFCHTPFSFLRRSIEIGRCSLSFFFP